MASLSTHLKAYAHVLNEKDWQDSQKQASCRQDVIALHCFCSKLSLMMHLIKTIRCSYCVTCEQIHLLKVKYYLISNNMLMSSRLWFQILLERLEAGDEHFSLTTNNFSVHTVDEIEDRRLIESKTKLRWNKTADNSLLPMGAIIRLCSPRAQL